MNGDEIQMKDLSGDKVVLLFEWGWTVQWQGWRRCLWLAAQIDLQWGGVAVVVFGLLISYHKKLKPDAFATYRS